jgi:hypothetical protein
MGDKKIYIVRDDKLMGNGAFGPRFFNTLVSIALTLCHRCNNYRAFSHRIYSDVLWIRWYPTLGTYQG